MTAIKTQNAFLESVSVRAITRGMEDSAEVSTAKGDTAWGTGKKVGTVMSDDGQTTLLITQI